MRFQKLPAHTTKYVMPLIVAMFMSFIMSGIITYKNIGIVADFLSIWFEAWIMAWVLAYPILFVVMPVAKRIVRLLVDIPPD